MAVGGAYTLLIEGDAYDAGTTAYSFNVQPVPPLASDAAHARRHVNGTLPAAAEHAYTFTLASPARLTPDSLIAKPTSAGVSRARPG